jgi:hypothetical protein
MGTQPAGVVPAGGLVTRMDSLSKVDDKHLRVRRIARNVLYIKIVLILVFAGKTKRGNFRRACFHNKNRGQKKGEKK